MKNFSDAREPLEQKVGRLLNERNLIISCAESCTGGLLTSRLTDVAGSSVYVKGSVVCYTNEIKKSFVGVPQNILDEFGAVSEQTALCLADGIRKKFSTDIGVGVTGLAGPGGGTEEKPVGLVFIAVSGEKGTVASRNIFAGDRAEIKSAAAEKALSMLEDYLSQGA